MPRDVERQSLRDVCEVFADCSSAEVDPESAVLLGALDADRLLGSDGHFISLAQG